MNKIYLIALIIFLIILILWFLPRNSTPLKKDNFKSGNEKLNCKSPAAISAAKNYYDKVGQYKGVFLMDPISSVQVDSNNCDIKYRPIPTPGAPRNDNEVDARRFTYMKNPEGWYVAVMGDWKSGFGNG